MCVACNAGDTQSRILYLHQNLMQVACARNLRKFLIQDSWLCITSIM